MRVISLWSGGKDSCFACYKAMLSGCQVISLFNFTQTNGEKSISHGLPAKIILQQAEQTGISILQKTMPIKNYREEFKALIDVWKRKERIEGIVFGDIYLEEHKNWIDKVCEESEIKALFPIWRKDTPNLIQEILDSGFKSIVVSVRKDVLGKEWLGRQVDKEFISDLNKAGNIDPCGEKGEYHTFVYDGPIFQRPVKFNLGEGMTEGDKYWFLNLVMNSNETV